MSRQSKFFINREKECDVPGLGVVKIKSVTVKQVREAFEMKDDQRGDTTPADFANRLISSALVAPKMEPVEIASLSDEIAVPLVECVAECMGLREEWAELDKYPPRERLYHAQFQQGEKLRKQLRTALLPITPLDLSGFLGASDSLQELLATQAQIAKVASSFQPTLKAALEFVYQSEGAQALQASQQLESQISKLAEGLPLMSGINLEVINQGAFAAIQDYIERSQELGSAASMIDQMAETQLDSLLADLARIEIPEPFFSDALVASGLNSPVIHTPTYEFRPIPTITSVEEVESRAEEAERRKPTDAYDTLFALETNLRRLIASELERHVGPKWWRQRVPETIRVKCSERKIDREDRKGGPPCLPIEYADLGFLKDIILRRDNWNEVFEPIFGSATIVVGEFEKMVPLRNDIAHSRSISDDDYLFFTVAAKWLQIKITAALRIENVNAARRELSHE